MARDMKTPSLNGAPEHRLAPLCAVRVFGVLVWMALVSGSPVWAVEPAADLSGGELAQLFEVFDADADGAITKPELREVIISFRVGLSEPELDRMMGSFDANGDGTLQGDEFSKLMLGFRQEDTSLEAQMERAFLRFDANRDGGLDAREVRALMEASGQTLTLRDAKGIVFEADTDGNGRIDTQEFSRPTASSG